MPVPSSSPDRQLHHRLLCRLRPLENALLTTPSENEDPVGEAEDLLEAHVLQGCNISAGSVSPFNTSRTNCMILQYLREQYIPISATERQSTFVRRGSANVSSDQDSRSVDRSQFNPQPLELAEQGTQEDIKVEGRPTWLQDGEMPVGPDGEQFNFVAQVPESYAFPKLGSAPEQPDSFSSDDYCRFLGNEIDVLGEEDEDDHDADQPGERATGASEEPSE